MKVWDAGSGKEILTLKGHTNIVYGVALSPDGARIASASRDKTVKVWDAATGQELLTLGGHKYYVAKVAFSPDGKRIVSVEMGGRIKLWDATPLPEPGGQSATK